MNDIEKAIEYFQSATISFSSPEAGAKAMKVRDLAISALQQQLTNGWIPVDSKLPTKEEYILKVEDEHTYYNRFNVSAVNCEVVLVAEYDGKEWYDSFTGEIYNSITAWRKAEKPYSEVSECKD